MRRWGVMLFVAWPFCMGAQSLLPSWKQGLWGYEQAQNGKLSIKAQFDDARPFYRNRAWVLRQGRWALINEKGRELAKTLYTSVEDFSLRPLVRVQRGGLVGLMDPEGKEVLPCQYLSIEPVAHGHWVASHTDGKKTLFDARLSVLLSGAFYGLRAPEDGIVLFEDESGWGLWKLGQVAPREVRFQETLGLEAGLLWVRMDGKWGLVDTSGAWLLRPSFNRVRAGSQGRWPVRLGALEGFADASGQVVVQPEYQQVGQFSQGKAWVKRDGRVGFIDLDGNTRVALRYEAAQSYANGFARVQRNGKWGYLDDQGIEVVPCQYESAEDFDRGYAVVQKKGLQGAINEAGLQIIPTNYVYIKRLSDSIWIAQTDENIEILNHQGSTIRSFARSQPPFLLQADTLSATVQLRLGTPNFRLANQSGDITLPAGFLPFRHLNAECVFGKTPQGMGVYNLRTQKMVLDGLTDAQAATSTRFWACRGGKLQQVTDVLDPDAGTQQQLALLKGGQWALCGNTGQLLSSYAYTQVSPFHEGYARVQLNGLWGVLDSSALTVLEPVYDWIGKSVQGYFPYQKKGQAGVTDALAREVVPAEHDYAMVCGEGVFEVGVLKKGLDGETYPLGRLIDDNLHTLDAQPIEVFLSFSGPYAGRLRQGRWQVLNPALEPVGPRDLDGFRGYVGNFAAASAGKVWGLLGPKAEWVIEPQFQDIGVVDQGRFAAKSNGKWGLMDTSGTWVLKPEFEDLGRWQGNLVAAKLDGRWGLTAQNQWVLKPEFDGIEPAGEGYWRTRQDRNGQRFVGLASPQGQVVLPCVQHVVGDVVAGHWVVQGPPRLASVEYLRVE